MGRGRRDRSDSRERRTVKKKSSERERKRAEFDRIKQKRKRALRISEREMDSWIVKDTGR